MTERTLIYLIGAPGSGKSTLMARLTQRYTRHTAPDAPPRDLLADIVTGNVTGCELGRRRGEFSGTDALSQSVIETVIPWLPRAEGRVLLGEGARLGNRRFLQAAADVGFEIVLGFLDHRDTPNWRAARAAHLGKTQSPSWVKGRETACLNLALSPPAGTVVIAGHPGEVYLSLLERIVGP